MYKLQNDLQGNAGSVFRTDGWSIPFDPANTDYQAYLAWLAEGNEPLPPDSELTIDPADQSDSGAS
jgi:hypothetical protein